MNLEQKVLQVLASECKFEDEAWTQIYIMNRKSKILKEHIENVFPIKEPGETGGSKTRYFTKLTPHERGHETQITGKTREELETKIIAYYLGVKSDKDITVRDTLIDALGGKKSDMLTNPKTENRTGRRLLQRYDKHFAKYSKLRISKLDENTIRDMLDSLLSEHPSKKEFNETVGALNKISEYCEYKHIPICPIKSYISVWRKYNLAGKKHVLVNVQKDPRDLAFNRTETSKIISYTLAHPCYRNLAVALILTTGLRIGEAVSLYITDIRMRDGYIMVTKTEDDKTRIIGDPKGGKYRDVVLSDDAVKIVQACLDYRKQDTKETNKYLFGTDNARGKGKIHREEIANYLADEVHHGILHLDNSREARSPHDCRRTYASLEYLNGTDINLLRAQLGHERTEQTWDYIKDVCNISERKQQLKGLGILIATPTISEDMQVSNDSMQVNAI